MSARTKRAIIEGLACGVLAGTVFAVVEVGAAILAGGSVMMPLRAFASIVMGRSAFDTTVAAMPVVIAGGVILQVTAAAFGLVYALVDSKLSTTTQISWARQGALGISFGVLLWVIHYQLVARTWFPWLLERSQVREAALYALCFGLPVALICTYLERRARRLNGVLNPA